MSNLIPISLRNDFLRKLNDKKKNVLAKLRKIMQPLLRTGTYILIINNNNNNMFLGDKLFRLVSLEEIILVPLASTGPKSLAS